MTSELPSSITFGRALRVVRRRGPVVLFCVLVAAATAFVFASHQAKQYTASATLLFQTDPVTAEATGLGSQANQPFTQGQQDTNVSLVTLGDVAAKTAAQLGPRWTGQEVRGLVSAVPNSDTNLVSVQATAASPGLAERVANTYAQTFTAERQQQAVAQIVSAQRLVNAQLAALAPEQRTTVAGLGLADRAQSLNLLAKLATGGVTVAGLASRPSSPSSPNIKKDVILGGLLGLIIGIALAFVLERLDRRLRDTTELEEAYQLPVLAKVPERADYEVLRTLGAAKDSGMLLPHDEVFNLLRSYLRYFSVDRQLRTVLITSSGPSEGKTTVSYNLAKVAAVFGQRVLLVEADLRRGSVLGSVVDRLDPSLPDVLIGEVSMDEAIRSVEIGPRAVLDVLIAAELPPLNAGELIESQAMEAVIERATATYDFVVIDTPPLTLVADAIPLVTKVDGVIVVGRVGLTRHDEAEHLRSKLERLRAPVLGIVANGVGADEGRRYGGYGYGYESRPTRPRDEREVDASALANGAASSEDMAHTR